jgi:hypothetical protein
MNLRFDERGKPILRVMQILRPEVYDSKAMEFAFEIGKQAHTQIEAKFSESAIIEHTYQLQRDEYTLELHPDVYFDSSGVVVEIKSLTYFVQEFDACVKQLSAYVSVLKAKRGLFLIYQGEFVDDGIDANGKVQPKKFKVKHLSPVYVPLMSWDAINNLLDVSAKTLLAQLRADGHLAS